MELKGAFRPGPGAIIGGADRGGLGATGDRRPAGVVSFNMALSFVGGQHEGNNET